MAQVIKPPQIVPFEISQLQKQNNDNNNKKHSKTCQGQDLTSGKHSEAASLTKAGGSPGKGLKHSFRFSYIPFVCISSKLQASLHVVIY